MKSTFDFWAVNHQNLRQKNNKPTAGEGDKEEGEKKEKEKKKGICDFCRLLAETVGLAQEQDDDSDDEVNSDDDGEDCDEVEKKHECIFIHVKVGISGSTLHNCTVRTLSQAHASAHWWLGDTI